MGHFLSLMQCHHCCIKGKTCNLPHPQCNSELPHSRPSFRFFEEFGFLVVSNPGRWSLSFIVGPLHWLSSYLQDLQQKSVFSFYPLELTCFKLLQQVLSLFFYSSRPRGALVGTLLISILGPVECRGDRVECQALSTLFARTYVVQALSTCWYCFTVTLVQSSKCWEIIVVLHNLYLATIQCWMRYFGSPDGCGTMQVVVVVLCGVWLPAAINIGSCVETVTDNWERSPASHQSLILQRRKRKVASHIILYYISLFLRCWNMMIV